jgi:choline dehydrogenase-like flavoprotein
LDSYGSGNEFDAIVVGSGPGGATVARELSRRRKKVLVLEKGREVPLKENILSLVRIVNTVAVGDGVDTMRALTTGGTTAVYAAIAEYPPLQDFRSLGIDLSSELEEAKKELAPAELPDALFGPQALRVRESAMALGHAWKKRPMLVDQSACRSGYSYEAKWNARTYLREAVEQGAKLVTGAAAHKVIVQGNKAVGVEYKVAGKDETQRAYGTKIVLAAGALASPAILRASGVNNVAQRGFYCDPCMTMIATVPGMKGKASFIGGMGTDFEDGISYGDSSLPRYAYRIWMLTARKLRGLFSHSKIIGAGFIVKDGLGGELREDGRYHKQFTADEKGKLRKARESTRKILQNAGGRDIMETGVTAARVGGLIRINEHLNDRLETQYANLHVCDSSMIPEDIRLAPTVTLVCLGKYLANHLAPSF